MAFAFRVLDKKGKAIGNYWLGHLDRSYVLAPGLRIPLHDAAAWCFACCAFVAAERLLTLAEIDAGLRQARSEAAAAKDQDLGRVRLRSVEDWELTRQWRQRRVSPRKCLACGSTMVRLLPKTLHVRHPVTEERVDIELACHMSMAIHLLYTPEGDARPD